MNGSGPLERSEYAEIVRRMKTAPVEDTFVMLGCLLDLAAIKSEATSADVARWLLDKSESTDWSAQRAAAERGLSAAEHIGTEGDHLAPITGYSECVDHDGSECVAFICSGTARLMRFLSEDQGGPTLLGVAWSSSTSVLSIILQANTANMVVLMFDRDPEVAGLLISMLEDNRIVLMPSPGRSVYSAVFENGDMDPVIAEVQAWAAA